MRSTFLMLCLASLSLAAASRAQGDLTNAIVFADEAKEGTLMGLGRFGATATVQSFTRNEDRTNTNVVYSRLYECARDEPRGLIILVDEQGREVSKTWAGKHFEQPLRPVTLNFWNNGRYLPIVHAGLDPIGSATIDPGKLFQIKRSGNYKFTLRRYLYIERGRDHLEPIIMPAVSIRLWLGPQE